MSRRRIIAGNWKMNKTPSEAKALIEELKPLVVNPDVDVVYCVPAIDLTTAIEATKGTNVSIGAENMYFEESGAYTGEISPHAHRYRCKIRYNRSFREKRVFCRNRCYS